MRGGYTRSQGADISCIGYDELFSAAQGRNATQQEIEAFKKAPLEEKNRLIREWVSKTGGRYETSEVEGRDHKTYVQFWRSDQYQASLQHFGNLPPAVQGVALELKPGEQASVDNTGHPHSSKEHGFHGDLYLVKRVSETEVEVTKEHIGRGFLWWGRKN